MVRSRPETRGPNRCYQKSEVATGQVGSGESSLCSLSPILVKISTVVKSCCRAKGIPVAALSIEVEQEDDGRWIAEVPALPGVMAYGQSRQEAVDRVQSLSLRVLADRLDHGEPVPQMGDVFAVTP
jgi:predicted RNase H-like HicB family nuclease